MSNFIPFLSKKIKGDVKETRVEREFAWTNFLNSQEILRESKAFMSTLGNTDIAGIITEKKDVKHEPKPV